MGRRMVIGEIDVTSNLSLDLLFFWVYFDVYIYVDVVVGDICKKSALQIQRQGVSRVATSVKAKVSGETERC
jgi:hypothetical protein